MSSKDQFEKGECYFLLGYHDRELRIPFIRTYIHIGKNIFGNDPEDFWYFQEAESFIEQGSASQRERAEYEDVMPVTQDGISSFVNWRGLIEELTENKAMQDQGKSFSERIPE